MLAALGTFAYTLLVLIEIALGAFFTMSGSVLVVVDRMLALHSKMPQLGAALALTGLALFFLGAYGLARLPL
ncbi:hypothetical protein NDN01_09985 [Sphingomonas sp. QA11]|uniref:hypothetical protein n=1 Tax=Sphingomonas sp. QA11 TaxID=2950605 RepID=UPI00234A58D0|nr:hypothetical protein [Sphingomonas sp. QA11]WCM29183.1 hypothetical protein NDN01_09985 [Sphingomonas sp. QA11]